ncbi:MAG: ABC transporter permease [Acidimicrobiia bacterium]
MTKHRFKPTLLWVDAVRESWLQVSRRPLRTVLTGLGVAIGAAAVVTTLGLTTTIRYQVSDEFDALLATQVDVRPADPGAFANGIGDMAGPGAVDPSFPPPAGLVERASRLSGVEGIAVLQDSMTTAEPDVALSDIADPTARPLTAPVRGINADGFDALGVVIDGPGWGPWHDERAEAVALLGRRTADALGIDHVRTGDQIFIDGTPFTLVGIVERSPRVSGLRNGVVIPHTATGPFLMDPERNRIVAVTAPGAAGDIEAALPLVLSPTDPDRYRAYSATRDQAIRRAVDDQMQYLAVGLGAVVLILGIVSIGNATLTSVLQRINEIGIRRALGARPRHIAIHILLDAGAIGAVGGAIGALLGVTAMLAVAAHQGWTPVLEPLLPPAAIVIGASAGIVAGVYPAIVASRLQPTEALRHD